MKPENFVKGMDYLVKHFPALKIDGDAIEAEIGYLTDEQFKHALIAIVRTQDNVNASTNITALILQYADNQRPWPEALAHILSEVRRIGSDGRPNLTTAEQQAVDAVGGWKYICGCENMAVLHAQLRDCYKVTTDVLAGKQHLELTESEMKKLPHGIGHIVKRVAKQLTGGTK